MPSPRYDLHLHSRAGRGELSARDLVALAADRGLAGIAVTDVDTIDGLAEASAAAQLFGITLIPGVEITCTYARGDRMHMIGYLIDPHHAALQQLLAQRGATLEVPHAASVIEAIHHAGGVAVLARPGMRHGGVDEEQVRALAHAGIDGLEVDHPGHGDDDIRRLARLAAELQLVEVAGSDDSSAHDSRLGCRTSSERVLEALRARVRQ